MKDNIIITLLLVLVVFGVALYTQDAPQDLGSVNAANEYHSTLTGENSGSADSIVLTTAPGALGSVVITGVAGGSFIFHDCNLLKKVTFIQFSATDRIIH